MAAAASNMAAKHELLLRHELAGHALASTQQPLGQLAALVGMVIKGVRRICGAGGLQPRTCACMTKQITMLWSVKSVLPW